MHKATFYEKYVKRILGFVFSLILLIVLFPVFLVISFFIKRESSGPIFFKQKRIGYKGETFNIYKFRSMVENAENLGSGIKIVGEHDPRITMVGKFLRKTGVDELPQLINILKGEMGFVGPRPPVEFHPYEGYEKYPKEIKKRFEVRPGVTGLAQVKVRNSVPWSQRFKYDLKYVEKISVIRDLKIILATIGVLNSTDSLYLEGEESHD